jgi:hypothetical protein
LLISPATVLGLSITQIVADSRGSGERRFVPFAT